MHAFADNVFRGALNHRRVVIVFAALLFVVSALCIPNVKINYQFSDYLPESSESTVSLRVMEEAFNAPTPNSNLMVEGLSLSQASDLAGELEATKGVEEVMWLGSVCDISEPLEMYDSDVVTSYKKGDTYLYQIALDTSLATQTMDVIRQAAASMGATNVAMAGDAINSAVA